MVRPNRVITLPILLLLGFITFSCAPAHLIYPVLKTEDFSKDIAKSEEIIQKEVDISIVTKAHLELALLYLHYKNPNHDYFKALQELEIYISLSPSGNTDEIQNLLTLLREVKKLADENQELIKTVEQLKHLDINIEEKRRQIK